MNVFVRMLAICLTLWILILIGTLYTNRVIPESYIPHDFPSDKALAYAKRCLENPMQRFFIVRYQIVDPSSKQIASTQTYTSTVKAYTLFAIPVYTISVEVPVGCSIVR